MKKLLLYSFSFFISVSLNAQVDTSQLHAGFIDASKTSLQNGSNLLNGQNHIAHAHTIEGSGYFLDDWALGTVWYEGQEFKNVLLKYDLYRDELIVNHPNGLAVILFTPRVSAFTIGNRHFINFTSGISDNKKLKPGYYEVLQNGRINFYAKREKLLEEKETTMGLNKKFISQNSFLAERSGAYYPVKKESQLFDLMPEKKSEIKNFMRDKGVNAKNDLEFALSTIVEKYNQSTK